MRIEQEVTREAAGGAGVWSSKVQALNQNDPSETEEIAWRGIELCRRGEWQEGVYWLGMAVEPDGSSEEDVPGLFYSYLGYGIARYQGKSEQGLTLCQRAVELDRYQPESYYFLAKLYLLLGDRRSAHEVVERGLEIDAGNHGLLRIKDDFGQRRSPLLPFLGRHHPLNRWLGRIRHLLLGPGSRRVGVV